MAFQRDMKFRVVCGLSFFLALFSACPQLRAQEKSFLWKAQSKTNTVFLLGSVHFLRKENYPLKSAIEQAYQKAKRIVLEIDLQSAAPDKIQSLIVQKGLYPDGSSLQQSVSGETFSLLEKRAQEFGLPVAALNRFRPWYAAVTLLSLKLNRLGFDQKQGLDRYFFDRAAKDKKDIAGLETLEYQIGVFDQMSPSDQEQMLLQTLKEMDLLEKDLDKLIQGWLAGDIEALDALLLESFRQFPKMQKIILVDRNRQWLPKIESLLSQGDPCLVVVGAAHLVGKEGVIEMLKTRGYTVEQL